MEHIIGKEICIQARIHRSKTKGSIGFMTLRKGSYTIQAVLSELSKEDIKWACSLPRESIVLVMGMVVGVDKSVTGCTITDREICVDRIYLTSESTSVLPFYDDVATHQETRLNARWLDMRSNKHIWVLQSKICQLFREYLLNAEFIEIHTPKIIPVASESGASVFKLDYFGRDAYLAQSPQLYKQMAIMGDLERVFEIGPVFRAENSNTHRHLCEFIGVDVEMELVSDHHELIDVVEGLFTHMFNAVCNVNDIDFVWELSDDISTRLGSRYLRLHYKDAMSLLPPGSVLDTANEKLLGAEIKKLYGVDFYTIDMFPTADRPFYTMPSSIDPVHSNSFDVFIRGEEVSSGSQRIHDVDMLERSMKKAGIINASYLDSFRLGAWSHGGFGIGLERVLMLLLGLKNIRSCSMFPRDPIRITP